MKKLLCLMLIVTLLCPIFSIQAAMPITVTVNGEKLNFDVPPMMIQDRTMVPLRAIFESLGAKVDYNDTTKKITATLGQREITLRVDTPAMYVNGSEYMLDVPATVVNGRTLVPVRAVAEAFKCQVDWNESTSTVSITYEKSIYDFGAPVIDFSNDDGIKSRLHYETRTSFEQKVLPSMLFDNATTFKTLLKKDEASILDVIDNELWMLCVDTAVATYLTELDPKFAKKENKEAIAEIDAVADKYELWPNQNYNIDLFKPDKTNICLLLNMAAIGEKVKVNIQKPSYLSPFIAVVYNTSTGKLSYFCLEKNDSKQYILGGYDEKRTHLFYGICDNNKRAFVEAVSAIITK